MTAEVAASRLPWVDARTASGMPAHQYPALLDLVASGRIDPGLLVGRVIGLDEAGAALVAMSGPATTTGMTVVRL